MNSANIQSPRLGLRIKGPFQIVLSLLQRKVLWKSSLRCPSIKNHGSISNSFVLAAKESATRCENNNIIKYVLIKFLYFSSLKLKSYIVTNLDAYKKLKRISNYDHIINMFFSNKNLTILKKWFKTDIEQNLKSTYFIIKNSKGHFLILFWSFKILNGTLCIFYLYFDFFKHIKCIDYIIIIIVFNFFVNIILIINFYIKKLKHNYFNYADKILRMCKRNCQNMKIEEYLARMSVN